MSKAVADVRNPGDLELTEFLHGVGASKSFFRPDALRGRRAVVFGALWHSIGAACAAMLAEFGCELIVLQGESEAAIGPTQEYLRRLGHTQSYSYVSDLSPPGSGKQSALELESRYPGIDLCLYISGISAYYPYTGIDTDAAHRLFQVNLFSMAEIFGVFLSAHLDRLSLNSSARLDLGGCSSIQALFAAGNNAGLYSASKAGVEQYLRGLGVQYAKQGVRTHCVAPGCVDTARHRSSEEEFQATRNIGRQTPVGEIAPSAAIAHSFLSSICGPANSVGGMLVCDGGWSASGSVYARDQN